MPRRLNMRAAVVLVLWLTGLLIPMTSAGRAPLYRALKLDSEIRLDGLPDERIWRQADTTAAFVDHKTGAGADLATTAQIVYDDQ